MKTLRLNVNLEGLQLTKDDKDKTPQELSTLVLKNIIFNWSSTGNRRGLTEDDRRRYYKILDLFDKAVAEKLETIELDDDWFGFIRKCKRESELLPSPLLRRVEELIDEVKDR